MSTGADADIELANLAQRNQEQDGTRSSFSERERRRRRSLLSSHNDASEHPTNSGYPTSSIKQSSLLDLLRLVQKNRVQIFSIEPDQRWNIRPELGKGASFAVEEANMAISSTLAHIQYRNLDLKGHGAATNFLDHTNTA